MKEHILIETAVRTPHQSVPEIPEGAYYDPSRGYWLYQGSPWTLSRAHKMLTKKADIETGEDQKSE